MKLEEALKSNKFQNELHKAGLNILYTAWWLKTTISKFLKEYDLTHEQYNVLRILKGKSPQQMCVKDVSCRMIEKNSNVPRIIDRLESKKFVKRSSSTLDKRETVITITAAGINILEIATAKINKVFDEIIEMDEPTAGILNKLLEQIREREN